MLVCVKYSGFTNAQTGVITMMKKMIITLLGLALTSTAMADNGTQNIVLVNKSTAYKMSVNYQVCYPDYTKNYTENCGETSTVAIKEADKKGKNWVAVNIPEVTYIEGNPVPNSVKVISASALDGSKTVVTTTYASNNCDADKGALLLDDVKGLPFLICSHGTYN
jgi:hypothetical protein